MLLQVYESVWTPSTRETLEGASRIPAPPQVFGQGSVHALTLSGAASRSGQQRVGGVTRQVSHTSQTSADKFE